jgi:hypothetical protein
MTEPQSCDAQRLQVQAAAGLLFMASEAEAREDVMMAGVYWWQEVEG